ncbi:hypothetical protein SAMN05444422_101290 [Halobiforma haloterrestris]|uniref:Uncharacterized protein n=1 Tax=Natronobacterium haloterrestre TaxID=148448 RepID=A0A1I1D9Z9_NATHA|nr:hypothetical protein [Halobiforma haloterrestris]SFB69908.1 hypothetical protein SAMN05444422_101290 [Halobiforma haloterrestris]
MTGDEGGTEDRVLEGGDESERERERERELEDEDEDEGKGANADPNTGPGTDTIAGTATKNAETDANGETNDDPIDRRRTERRECAVCGEEVPAATYREHLLKECSGP